MASDTYKIVRMYQGEHPKHVIGRGYTLEEAQEHCKDKETSSRTATSAEGKRRTAERGPWFDGYTAE